MFRDPSLYAAELAFLNAPFRERGWDDALALLAAATRTRLVQLVGVGGPMALSLNLLTDQPHDPHGHLANPLLYGPINWRINTTAGPLTLQHEAHYRAYREGRRTDVYDDAVSDLDLPHGCQTALMLDSDGLIGLSLLRTSREGPCDAGVLAAFSILARQAQRAARVQLALGREASEMMLDGPGSRAEATLLLDGYGGLLAMSETAECLFDEPGGLRLHGLRVQFADPREDRALCAAMARLLASDGVSGPVLHEMRAGFSVTHPQGRWRLFATRLPAVPNCLNLAPQLCLTLKALP